MNLKQQITLLYTGLGIVCGIVSYLAVNLTWALIVPLIIYAISNAVLLKYIKTNEMKKLSYNNLITFILVWMTVWVFLYTAGR